MFKRISVLLYLQLIFSFFMPACASDIAVATMAIGETYEQIVAPGIENKKHYCDKHGYDFFVLSESMDTSRPIPWSKIKLLQEILSNKEYKWVFWTDADAVVTNFAYPLEDIIDENYDLIITTDLNGINSGHMLLKNSEWSAQFLETVYSHTECINHPWWEQMAIILEIQNNPETQKRTKIFPQRVMNSYVPEVMFWCNDPLRTHYQRGDFIVHFASCPKERLLDLMIKYSSIAVDDPEALTLDNYLGYYGFRLSPRHSHINEGYVTETQKKGFIQDLQRYGNIHKVAEIGFNGGHSVQIFFENCCPDVKVLSFDLYEHDYTKPGVEYMQRKYKDRFHFIPGDSHVTVPEYAMFHPDDKYDLIYVDGDHSFQGCYDDIVNCRKLATPDTILWVDDYNEQVWSAVNRLVHEGFIKIVKHNQDFHDPCGPRVWVECRYVVK